MRRVLFLSLLLLALMTTGLVSTASAAPPAPPKQVVGYFIEWGVYARNYLVKNIVTSGSADKLTAINYAFANVVPNANGQPVCALFDEWADYQVPWTAEQSVDGQAVTWPNPILGNFQQLKALKALYPNIKILISIGGWTGSKYFSDAALPEYRAAFVQSCIDLFIKGDLPNPGWGGMGGPGAAAGVFDGIDIDWEYPGAEGNTGNIIRPDDTPNFTALLAEFRKQLDAVNPSLLLTIAAPAGRPKIANLQLGLIPKYLNWINVMTYDYHGGWETRTNFNTPLLTSKWDPSAGDHLSTDETVRTYLYRGVPARKIVIGVPFYGRGWAGVPQARHGLYQESTGLPAGTWEAGVEDYKVLVTKGYPRYNDAGAKDAWLYSAEDHIFWTFDDDKVMAQRARYVKSKNLGGIMFWELSGDTDDGELVGAISKVFK